MTLDGFAAADGGYEWDGETASPTIRYRLPANRTSASATLAHDAPSAVATTGSTAAQSERYLFVDPGPWALVTVPSQRVGWRFRPGAGDVGLVREAQVDGPGAVGTRIAFLGPHTVHERTAHGQTFRLIVPDAADGTAAAPDAILDSVAAASDTLRVGDRDESVLLVAAPADVPWAVRGLQTGDADAWVRADEPLDSPESPWLHEYVHTRQSFATTAGTKWVVEGSADYYAALLALRQGHVGFDAFAAHLARGERSPFADTVLADQSTWVPGAQYRKGALVAGELDRRVRLASDGGATLASVLTRLNAASEPVDAARFAALVAAAGDEATGDAARRFTRTEAVPEMWSPEAHAAAFGTPVARITVESGDALAVSGPFRNETVAAPATLAAGETVTVPVTVRNAGGAPGEYRVALAADGRTVASANGTLAAGATRTVRLSWTPETAGAYELTVRDGVYGVVVEPAAAPTVASLSTNRSTVAPGEWALVTAAVTAPGGVPAEGTVTVRVDGTVVATERVRVGPNRTATLRVPVRFDAAGESVVSAGDARATVSVVATAAAGTEGAPGTATDDGTAVTTPGFGPGVALAALATALTGTLAAARSRRRRSER
ncbi:CARDB domain-containing protein [Halobaculum litoreum]|uniref:CARDB domain-containing protein n=1 Tax=Halobaculum litoreum TaxID=3031998 RepID=A0ABD5XQ88_9EURY